MEMVVFRNASAGPLKYLSKYFSIKATEDNLAEVETLGEEASRPENAVSNLAERELMRRPDSHTLAEFAVEFFDCPKCGSERGIPCETRMAWTGGPGLTHRERKAVLDFWHRKGLASRGRQRGFSRHSWNGVI